MHLCQEHTIRQSCNLIFANLFSLFMSILLNLLSNTLGEWGELIYIYIYIYIPYVSNKITKI